jgi:hypothetical protein
VPSVYVRGVKFVVFGGGFGVYVAGEWVQVLMEKSWYLPRCCSCGHKELVRSPVPCV